MKIHILNRNDVKNVLTMRDTIEAMHHAFLQLSAHQVEMPLRSVIKVSGQEAVSLFMPAYLSKDNQLGIKIVSSFPHNNQQNLPTINGAILLINEQTGEPKALIEAGLLTALRTGAVSGFATDLLAKEDAKILAIIGSGVQAKTQIEAVLCVRKITEIIIYSRNQINAEKLAKEVKQEYPSLTSVKASKSLEETLSNADVICTATNATIPVVELKNIKNICHINAIGSHNANMKEIDRSVMSKAKIIVDQTSAAIAEAGEIIDALENNIIKKSDLIELGSLINQKELTANLRNTVTVFKSVGLAIQDISAAEKALSIAIDKKIGTIIDF